MIGAGQAHEIAGAVAEPRPLWRGFSLAGLKVQGPRVSPGALLFAVVTAMVWVFNRRTMYIRGGARMQVLPVMRATHATKNPANLH